MSNVINGNVSETGLLKGSISGTGQLKGNVNGLLARDGDSAYEIWLAQGNTGTELDFLASLKGEPGEPGSPGIRGEKGEKGDPGSAGKDGVDGKDGIDGKDGYTPQKGVDYFDGKDGYTPQKGVDYFDGKDGYTPQKGVDYFDGKDGADGVDGRNGSDGKAGADGKDGVSPVVSVSKVGGVTTITITDAEGTKTATILDGEDGEDGTGGDVDLSNYVKKEDLATDDTPGIVYSNSAAGVEAKYGVLRIVPATEAVIAKKQIQYLPIVPKTIDQAVKVGITTNKKTLTDDEKTSACTWLGAAKAADIPTIVETAIDEAKASGEFDGADGVGISYVGMDIAQSTDSATAVNIRLTNGEGNIVLIPNGAPGKTAYAYAQDGGYTGTEAEFAQKMAQATVDKLMFISPDGSDSNDGLTANAPKKTVKACVNAGATRISAKRGVYNEVIMLWNVGTLEIFPTDNDLTYAVGTEREPIVFDTSDNVAVSSLETYNAVKRVGYSNAKNTQFDKVFTKKSLPPIANEYGQRYNSTIWLLSGDEKTVCIKLKPVLTVAECEAEANTFTYVSGYIYINADMSGVEKIIVPTNWDSGFYVNGAEKVKLCEVEARFSGTYNFDLKNCAYFDLYKCSAKYTSYASGFHPFNSNGRMTACYATKNFDGFGISGYGHTTFVDCVSEFNFDDGMSHHERCEGTVIGGRYEGNGKGGNAPAYGAKVNIYGGIYKDNALFGIGYLWASGLEPASGTVQGAVMVGNPIGLRVNANCNVIAANCLYDGNTKETENNGNLVEYNANFVRSVNGVLPDENGNVTVSVGGLPYTNLLPLATDTSDAIYNGTGYMNGNRLNSSAVVKPQSGCGHTGFIRAIPGGVLRFKNIPACTIGYGYIHYFAGDKTTVAYKCVNIGADTFAVDENGVYSYTLADAEAIEYIRFSYGEMSEESIITINEEITD